MKIVDDEPNSINQDLNETLETLDINTGTSSTLLNSENMSLNSVSVKEKTVDIERQQELLVEDKVFGNHINNKFPRKMGNVFTYLFIKNNPIIVIGPDCKFYIYIRSSNTWLIFNNKCIKCNFDDIYLSLFRIHCILYWNISLFGTTDKSYFNSMFKSRNPIKK